MIQHRKKYISNLLLGHLSSSPLVGLFCSLIGRRVFTCRLSERRPPRLILAFYYRHLFNKAGGSTAEDVQPVRIRHRERLNHTHLPAEWPRDGVQAQLLPAPTCSPDVALVTLSVSVCMFWSFFFFSYVCQDGSLISLTASYQRESDPVGSIDCAEPLNVMWAPARTHVVSNIWASEGRWRRERAIEREREKTDWFDH